MAGFSWEAFESSPEFTILRRLTERQADTTYTPQNALRQIHDLTMKAAAEMKTKPGKTPAVLHPDVVADDLVELACRTDRAEQSRLVEFASKLFRLTEVDPESGEPLKWDDGKTLWTETNSLLLSANRAWRDSNSSSDISPMDVQTYSDDTALSPDAKRRWENLMAFTAQLTQSALIEPEYPSNPTHWAHVALWSMRTAFEGAIQLPEELVRTTALRVACLWFIYAADSVWACVQKGVFADAEDDGFGYIGKPGSHFQDKTWRGFERERFDVWVRQLELAEQAGEGLDRETMGIIEEALKKARNASRH